VQAELEAYVAASASLHLADGWAYLGRAFDAHVHNDLDASRHAAYYAELRAALALLATQGVGIFDHTHVVLTAKGCTSRPGLGTHDMVWEVLVYWADNPTSAPAAARLFGKTIQPYGISLQDWFVGLPFGAPWKPVASRWLRSWGADLKWFVHDRKARNVASYGANQIRSPAPNTTTRSSKMLRMLWTAFEPSPGRPFQKLDLHLLRRSVDATYIAAKGGNVPSTSTAFASMAKAVASNASSSEQAEQLERFLLRQTDPDDLAILSEADGRLNVYGTGHHAQVMARAAVLLRLASGACTDLIQPAGLSGQDLALWRGSFAVDRGLWDTNAPPTDATDLWADVQAAMEDLERWEAGASVGATLFDWRTAAARAVESLTVTDRLLAWGL